ncbi:uncharacterized protein BJ171DRAFT_254836 [Polychytrium aggregatum]|uniref:uncharacterized protein n=1 Tax=Polychytrium aggregatum TaxID=110093 RepID=UPI0022FE9ACE|nr:uncharacterized protein BJ171DRAFT_254836 [Polychytrium aggregatum]KAI9207763.1 hypothetical protein BJ171DRAFT_254836 [Polychytrium aggregatum]
MAIKTKAVSSGNDQVLLDISFPLRGHPLLAVTFSTISLLARVCPWRLLWRRIGIYSVFARGFLFRFRFFSARSVVFLPFLIKLPFSFFLLFFSTCTCLAFATFCSSPIAVYLDHRH